MFTFKIVRSTFNKLVSTNNMKRFFDFFFASVLLFFLFIPFLIIYLLLFFTSGKPVIYWSERVGRKNKLFKMPKFRSMQLETPAVATHLLDNPNMFITPIGSFLRKSSLDELPQLWSILKGDMSFVGPRPALFNQIDLIMMRNNLGVDKLIPGLTGWAQINGRDELSIKQKVELDFEYMKRKSFLFDLHILWLTVKRVIRRKGVSH